MQVWITTADNGGAHVILPMTLTSADVKDLDQWFKLILRSVKKRAAAPATAGPQET